MASQADPPQDPALEGDYDYQGGEVQRPDLLAALETRVDGDVRFDEYSRQMYATDASAYEVTPIGVVLPASTDDVASVVSYCADEGIPVLPRGGATSLAGQTVNEAVVVDFTRYMDGIESIDPDGEMATVQSGAIIGELNTQAAPHGLKFAPDPAWRDKSAIGGAIGNNSTGAHSLVYGKTDAYVEEVEVVLADGTVTRFGDIEMGTLRDRADAEGDIEARIAAEVVRILEEESTEIVDRYPTLKRNVSGYNLDRLVDDFRGEYRDGAGAGAPDPGPKGTVNLGRLLAGSEGTLAVITEATVSMEPIPETKAIGLLTYENLGDAMEDVAPILEHEPAAVEVMDDILLDLAADTPEFEDVVGMLPDGVESALLVEFYADSDEDGHQQVADLIADRLSDQQLYGGHSSVGDTSPDAAEITSHPRRATEAMEAHDEETRSRFWKMRKAGLPILLSRTSDQKHVAFTEDCAVPPEHLPEFTREFEQILADHDTFASFYAHAGPGVLHIRPLLNLKSMGGVETMESIADDVTDLVVRLGGSVSGEHGDGRARTQWNRQLYGEQLWESFRSLKTAFDPDWLLNPGQVCGDVEMTEHLRYGSDYEFDAGFDPALNWDNENGFEGMSQLCHGCGGCRGSQETTGGMMCPTYRAVDEEIQSTRGRANMLREAMGGQLPDDPTDPEFVTEVLDLCIGCKGCAKDCPSGVDLAKMKAEATHAHHEEEGASLRDHFFARFEKMAPLGSKLAPLANAATSLPGSDLIAEKALGIARERDFPTFVSQSLPEWFEARGGAAVPQEDARRRVLLFPDAYTAYTRPVAGKAAVRVLEAANIHVSIPDISGSGRPAFSKGFLGEAQDTAIDTVETLAPQIEDGWDVVVVEPSDAVMLQSDYLDLLVGEASEMADNTVRMVAGNTYGACEYLDSFQLDAEVGFDAPTEQLTYHGHCHQKATQKDHHAVGVLRRAGYGVDPLDSTCCGMAGSFGYEAEHYSLSQQIGQILFDQVAHSDGDTVVAPGTSCRTQLEDSSTERQPVHPMEKLAQALS